MLLASATALTSPGLGAGVEEHVMAEISDLKLPMRCPKCKQVAATKDKRWIEQNSYLFCASCGSAIEIGTRSFPKPKEQPTYR